MNDERWTKALVEEIEMLRERNEKLYEVIETLRDALDTVTTLYVDRFRHDNVPAYTVPPEVPKAPTPGKF